jgi:hypothetical protein
MDKWVTYHYEEGDGCLGPLLFLGVIGFLIAVLPWWMTVPVILLWVCSDE